jgi:hypothetical protein
VKLDMIPMALNRLDEIGDEIGIQGIFSVAD